MMISSFALIALLATSAPVSAAIAVEPTGTLGKSVKITWKGDSFKSNALSEELPEAAREAIEYYRPWAEEMGYVMQLSDKGDFMMLTHKKSLSSREWSKAIAPALAMSDELAPLPDREAKGVETGGDDDQEAERMQFSWGEVRELERDTATFLKLKNSDHMLSLLKHIGDLEKHEASWASRYDELPGLILHKPLVGIIVASAPGVEEWDPLNESVNRIARMMLSRRFGKTPFWLTLGIAWNVEFEVRGNIFCFPHRDDFVGVAEHNGWRDDLKRQFKKRNGPPLDINQLASWQIGTYDPVQAGRAWGIVSYIRAAKPEALSLILEELRIMIDEKGRINHGDGTWELIPNFSLSPQDQLDVFERHLGKSFTQDVANYFNKGMKKPSKR